MSKSFRKDLAGQRFGRLTVLEFVPTKDKGSYWRCKCSCGNEVVARSGNLLDGNIRSCGCLVLENNQENDFSKTHGKSYTRLYGTWVNMKSRCFNTNHKSYKNYGGRGISICDEWKDNFQAFYDWAMANGYKEGVSIDRINNNGNYEPSNCRWADRKTQNRNKRNTVYVEYSGEKVSLPEAAEKSGINYIVLKARYNHGDRGDQLFRPTNTK